MAATPESSGNCSRITGGDGARWSRPSAPSEAAPVGRRSQRRRGSWPGSPPLALVCGVYERYQTLLSAGTFAWLNPPSLSVRFLDPVRPS